MQTVLSKHIFMGKVQHFHRQTQILIVKNCTFSFSAHVFMGQNMLRFGKHIFMGKVHFHGQTELHVITACVPPR